MEGQEKAPASNRALDVQIDPVKSEGLSTSTPDFTTGQGDLQLQTPAEVAVDLLNLIVEFDKETHTTRNAMIRLVIAYLEEHFLHEQPSGLLIGDIPF